MKFQELLNEDMSHILMMTLPVIAANFTTIAMVGFSRLARLDHDDDMTDAEFKKVKQVQKSLKLFKKLLDKDKDVESAYQTYKNAPKSQIRKAQNELADIIMTKMPKQERTLLLKALSNFKNYGDKY
jgi:protein subunit release factor A